MKGLHFSFLAGIILVVLVVAVGFLILMPVSGFDVKKYFGLQPILGEPGELGFEDIGDIHPTEVSTRCKKFYSWNLGDYQFGECKKVGDVNYCVFESSECPPNTYAVSCAAYTNPGNLDQDSIDKWGDDGIVAMYIEPTNKFCTVIAIDTDGTEVSQLRKVGVLCADIGPTDIEYKWGSWEDGTNNPQTIGSGVSCSLGYSALSSMVQTDLVGSTNIEDQITQIILDSATLKDPKDSVEYQKKFGKVCLKDSIFNECQIKTYSSPKSVKGGYGNRGYHVRYNNKWYAYQTCPGDSQLLFCGGGFFSSPTINSKLLTLVNSYFNPSFLGGKTLDTNIQSCELVVGDLDNKEPTVGTVALCAENLWHWTEWITSTDAYPLSFTSPLCPDGTKAIACASDTASLEDGYKDIGAWPSNPGGGKYGEDAINSIFITVDKKMCIVRARDKNGGDEHKRRVGGLCIDETIYNSDFSYKEQAFSQASGNDYVSFESPPCDDGYLPVYCTVKMDATSDAYKEDQIIEIDIDVANRKCKVTLADQQGTKEFKGEIGVMCAKADKVKINNDWVHIDMVESDDENPFFKSVECSSGFATTALTITDSDNAYKEDFIISMVSTSGKNAFVVQAEDTIGVPSPLGSSNEHRRRVGAICVDYPETSFK